MKKKHFCIKRLLLTACALLLVTCLLFCTVYASPLPIGTRSVTDWDDSFPLSLDPVVDPSSIRLIPVTSSEESSENLQLPSTLDASQYVDLTVVQPEYTVDRGMLEVGLQISLKEAFDFGYSYTLKIHQDGVFLIDDVYNTDDSVTINHLEYDSSYSIDVTVEDNNKITEYIGTFFYGIDYDNTVFISMSYSTIETFKTQTLYVNTVTESESNNSTTTADVCEWGQSYSGTLSTSSDVDFIKLINPDNKFRRINAIFKNNSNTAMYFRLYYGDANNQIGVCVVNPNSCEYWSDYIPDTLSGTYYFKVTDKDGNASNSAYLFNANLASSYVWYSQFGGHINGVNYWNTEKLDRMTFSNGKVFVNNNNSSSVLGGTGCALASAAMIFRNDSRRSTATMTDIRTGQVGQLMADPFTVYMANNGMSTLSYTTTSSGYSTSASTNVAMQGWSSIGTKFGYSGCTLTSYSNSNAQTVKNKIKEQIQQNHWGVVLWFKKASEGRAHYLVAVGYQTDSSGNVSDIIVCDPYTLDPSRGDNVLFANCISANRTDATSYTWADLAAYNVFYD